MSDLTVTTAAVPWTDVAARLLIRHRGVIKCRERQAHRSVESRQRKKPLPNNGRSELHSSRRPSGAGIQE